MGTIVGLFTKLKTEDGRGIPKVSTGGSARVTTAGMEGDHNFSRVRRDSPPERALLLWTEDARTALNDAGWPVQPGDIGENVLIDGVPFTELKDGDRWALGELEIELSWPSGPCSVLGHLPYVGGRLDEFRAASMGRRGMYAKVLTEGELRVGDEVRRLA